MNLNSGILYLVPTPIGNLEDITYRALRVLQEVDLIGAEDTRHTMQLLTHFQIQKPIVSYHEHNKDSRGDELIQRLLEGQSIAVVSDAGMPAISDPGADVVRLAIEAGITVVPLPGANAGLTALIASGLDTTEFTFLGFLPKRKPHRRQVLERVRAYEGTLLFYESPHRLWDVLEDMQSILGNRPIVIGRELTKKFETFYRSTLEEVLQDRQMIHVKGEFVIILGGATTGISEEETMEPVDPVQRVAEKIEAGMPKKEAIREVAKELGLARRDVYNAVEAELS